MLKFNSPFINKSKVMKMELNNGIGYYDIKNFLSVGTLKF
jgi:hypothetical protein